MVLYQSRGGSTEKVAKAIAAAAKTRAHNLSAPFDYASLHEGEVVFVGGGVYAGKADPSIVACLKQLAALETRPYVALFGTSMQPNKASEVMKAAAREADLDVCPEIFDCQGKFLLFVRSHPDAKDLLDATAFAERVIRN